MALLDQAGRCHRAVDSPRHGYEDASVHPPVSPARGTNGTAVSIVPSFLRTVLPSTPASFRPLATSTWDGSTAPVEHADPLDAATPARSRCMSNASLSAPSIATLSR